ncbi:UDP-glucose 6-dehydrogenase [Solibacillus sp. FSL R5-0691]|uniref:UDP-glucose 6-dehydrogenase n=1 Tax=Solibacillus sp. FSL R5-0691 TaxID=2921653 RepID=UPI0030D13828
MLQLFFNDNHLISITGDQDILVKVPDNYKHYDLINIRSESVNTEHLVEAFEFAMRKKDPGAVHAAAYYAKLKNMYVQKKRALSKN